MTTKILGRLREIVLTECDGDDETNVIRVWFKPIDQSGVAYAVTMCRSSLRNEIQADRQARYLRLTNVAPSNDEASKWAPRRYLIRFKMSARMAARARAWVVQDGEWTDARYGLKESKATR